MKQLLLLSTIFFLLSCTSKHEEEAIQELTTAYGGEVTISNGVSASTDKGSSKYKKIIVNKSGAVDEGIIESEILASRFALTIFNKLDSSEREFDKIIVELNKSNGQSYNYEISKKKIEIFEKEYIFVNKWIAEIKNNRIEESYKYLNDSSTILPKYEAYKEGFGQLNEKFGPIETVWFDGYVFENVSDGSIQGEIHQFIYDFRTKKGIYAMKIFVNPADVKYKIYLLNIDAD